MVRPHNFSTTHWPASSDHTRHGSVHLSQVCVFLTALHQRVAPGPSSRACLRRRRVCRRSEDPGSATRGPRSWSPPFSASYQWPRTTGKLASSFAKALLDVCFHGGTSTPSRLRLTGTREVAHRIDDQLTVFPEAWR